MHFHHKHLVMHGRRASIKSFFKLCDMFFFLSLLNCVLNRSKPFINLWYIYITTLILYVYTTLIFLFYHRIITSFFYQLTIRFSLLSFSLFHYVDYTHRHTCICFHLNGKICSKDKWCTQKAIGKQIVEMR